MEQAEPKRSLMQIFTKEIIRDFSVITLEIQALDISNSERVSARLEAAMKTLKHVVVDLGALRYFDVNGYATILHWAAGSEKTNVRLCSDSGRIQALFELLSANTLVPLFQTREEAMEAFEHSSGGRSEGKRETETLARPQESTVSLRRAAKP